MANNQKITLSNLQYERVYTIYIAIWRPKPATT
jgi:hypothetical protein